MVYSINNKVNALKTTGVGAYDNTEMVYDLQSREKSAVMYIRILCVLPYSYV